MRFLVVEDVESMNRIIADCLKEYNPEAIVESAYDGKTAMFMALHGEYDLIVLDLMLPYLSGSDVLKKLRETSACPVIILTALAGIDEKVKLFELGADDYLVKPFDRRELIVRVNTLLKRRSCGGNIYSLDGMDIDRHTKCVKINGKIIDDLSGGKLYDILVFLIKNVGIRISAERLFNRIWGIESETVQSVVTVYVSKLRKILKTYGGDSLADHLCTVKNVGYYWDEGKK